MSPRSSRLSRAARQKLRARGLPVALAVLASLVAVGAWRITPTPAPAVSGSEQPPAAAATHAAAPGTVRAGSGSAPGSILWSIQGAEEYRASATIDASGAVYVGNEGGTFRKLDPTTGETQWTFDCCADQPTPELDEERGQECNVDSTAAVDADGDLWVGCWNGTLVQLDADGGELCRHLAQDEVSSSPAIAADGTVYVGSEDRMLWAVSGEDCSVLWQQHFPDGSVYGAPLVAPTGMVVSTSADDHIYAWNPDGTPRWRIRTGFDVYSSAARGSDGTLYVGSGDHTLLAVTPDGGVKWRFEARGRVDTSPAVHRRDGQDRITFGSWDGHVYQVDDTGRLLWKVATGDEVWSSPVVSADGVVYIGSNDDHIYAIDPTGSVLWKTRLDGDLFASPALGPDGTLYVGTHGGRFFALRTGGPGVSEADPWPQFKGGPLRRGHACGEQDWSCVGTPATALERCNGADDDGDGAVDEGAACPDCGFGTCTDSPTSTARCADGACVRDCLPGFSGADCTRPEPTPSGPPGSVAWVVSTDDAVRGTAAVDPTDGAVLVGSADFRLRRIAPGGEEACAFHSLYGIQGEPVVAPDGVAWFGGEDQHLYGIDSACAQVCGLPLLGFAQGANIAGRPALLEGGDLVFGSGDGRLYRLDPGRCEAEPLAELGGTIYGGPLVLDDRVVQGSYAGALVSLSLTTGEPVWTAPGLGKLHGSPAASPDGKTVYVSSRDGSVRALSAETGALRWRVETPDELWAAPSVDASGNLYLGGFDGVVRSLGPSGALRWSTPVGSPVRAEVALDPSKGGVWVATDAGAIVSLGPDGSERWRTSVGAPILGPRPTLTPEGVVVVGTQAGHVVALRP